MSRKAALPKGFPAQLVAGWALLALATAAEPAHAQNVLPTHGSVAAGTATIQPGASSLTINQSSQNAVINWSSFSIGSGNAVNFNQPNSSAAALNRVGGTATSTLAGQLNANGQVYLVNPNGIVITKSGAVNVGGGFVATTLGISDDHFMGGLLHFAGDGASAAVDNQGSITAASGGFVGLFGGSVANSGVIAAPLGKVGLGSGERATLNLTGDNFLQVALPTNATTANGEALVDMTGKVKAAGGLVQLKAATAANAVYNAVNVPGEINASSAVARGGKIILGGGPGGEVAISGQLSASGKKGGGAIALSGRDINLTGAKVEARSARRVGGSVTLLASNSISLAWTAIDVSGRTGGGSIMTGGSHGPRTTLPVAATVSIDSASTLTANATYAGNGGSVQLDAIQQMTFNGSISAQGGPNGGNGGFVEVSGGAETINGTVNVLAPAGATGTLLLDPYNIDISTAPNSGGSFSGGVWTPNATSNINVTTLETLLASANVVISTGAAGSAGADAGNITVDAPISWFAIRQGSYATSLTLTAANAITINAPINVPYAATDVTAQSGVLILSAAVDTTTVPGASLLQLSFGGDGSVNFAAGSGAGRLKINGAAYTLLFPSSSLSGVSLTGNYALAANYSLPYNTDAPGSAAIIAPSQASPFSGVFEGLGHTISGLVLSDTTGTQNLGLFGYLTGTARNLTLANVAITGGGDLVGIAGVAGRMDSPGLVQNVQVTGSLTALSTGSPDSTQNTAAGGIGGFVNGYIVNSSFSGTVAGDTGVAIGGLAGNSNVGQDSYGEIYQSWSMGEVDGSQGAHLVGGLVGGNNDSVIQSWSSATVLGADASTSVVQNVGGLIGKAFGPVQNSYATGDVSAATIGSSVGGLVGYQNSGAPISSSHATGTVAGGEDANVGGLVGLSADNILASYSQSNVSATATGAGVGGLVGDQSSSSSYIDASYATGSVTAPAGSFVGGLVGVSSGLVESLTGPTFASGDVSSPGVDSTENPVSAVGGLIGAQTSGGSVLGAYATGDVSANAFALIGGLIGDAEGSVGNSTLVTTHATGTVSDPGDGAWIGGLIGFLDGSLSGSGASAAVNAGGAADAVGGLVGYSTGTVQNVSATGLVTSSGANSFVGGLIGDQEPGASLNGGFANGAVANSGAGSYVGGLVGYNNGAVTLSGQDGTYSSGAVSSSAQNSYVGGLVGYLDSSGSISQSYAFGNVSAAANGYIGGLVGYATGQISESFSTGVVTAAGGGSGNGAGGLVGWLDSGGSITNSYASGPVIGGSSTDVGGLVGDNGGTITNTYSWGVAVTVSGSAGGLVGRELSGGSTANSFWDVLTSGLNTSSGGLGLTTAQMQGETPVTGSIYLQQYADPSGALGDIWGGGAGGLYPYLKFFYPSGVQAVSGFAYAGATSSPLTTGLNGVNYVWLIKAGGEPNPAVAEANGYYYYPVPANTLPETTYFAAYTQASGAINAVTYQLSSGATTIPNVNVNRGWQIDLAGGVAGSLSSLNAQDASVWSESALSQPTLANRQIDLGASPFELDTNASQSATLVLNGSGSVTQTAGSVSASSLVLEGGGSFNLTSTGNSVAVLAASAAALGFSDASSLTIGAATDASGVTTTGISSPTGSGNVALTTGGALTFDDPVTLTSGTVTATAEGDITQSSSGIIDPVTLTVSSTAGDITLDAANILSGLSGSAAGSFSVSATGDYTIDGVTAGEGTIALVSVNGGLTLDAPVSVTNGNVVISAATTFVNNVGAGAISTPAGFWQVYSAAPSGDVFNNLNSNNTAIWDAKYTGSAAPTSNRYIFAYQPTLLFTPENASKSYGTDYTASLQSAYTVSGFQPGVSGAYLADSASTAFEGTPVVTSTGASANASVAGGPYAILVATGGLSSLSGYAFSTSSGAALTVTPLTLTYSISTGSGVQGSQPTTGQVTLNGVLPGDAVTPTVGASQNGVVTPLDPSTPAGVYQQFVSALSNSNYVISDTGNVADPLVILPASTPIPPIPPVPPIPPITPTAGLASARSPALVTPDELITVAVGGGSSDPVANADGALSGFITNCDVAPRFPMNSRRTNAEQTLRNISQTVATFFRRCEAANPIALADALDSYALELQQLAPQLPQAFHNIPGIVANAARKVRAAKNRGEVAAALGEAVVAIHKELTLVRSEDPAQGGQAARDGEVVVSALNEMSVALVSSGGL